MHACKNIETLQILTELSKGHGRVIICSQIQQIDKDIIHPAFCRAVFIKRSKKVMKCKSKHFSPRIFYNLPRSPIRFDADRVAEFIDRKLSKTAKNPQMELTYRICSMYVKGKSMTQITRELGYHTEEVRRYLKKGLKSFLEHEGAFQEEKEVKHLEAPTTIP